VCGIRTDGTLWCWADDGSPELAATGADYVDVASGEAHVCGLHADGTLACWGAGSKGQLGDGNGTDSALPRKVEGGGPFAAVVAGGDHTCAITADRSLWCWGDDSDGQVGDGAELGGAHPVPVRVGAASDWLSVSAGPTHTCGVRAGGSLYCWGHNDDGELGDGTAFRKRPTLSAE
jgi:alpha-tubulin suppressor-like RCC1 family protein